jgi:pimeloyl-ACP methyl ester carboxylesterase
MSDLHHDQGKKIAMFTPVRPFAIACTILAGALLIDTHAEADSTSKPVKTIVLVHGAFSESSSWDRVVPRLLAKGYNVVAVHEPLTSLADDVAATTRVIDAQPGEVLLVGHSYGGAVITEAGNNSKVSGLVYLAAFGPDAGESIDDLTKGRPPQPWVASVQVDGGGFASLPEATFAADFAPGLPSAEAKLLEHKQGPINTRNFQDKIKNAAWHNKPAWFILTTEDQMIDPSVQALMAKRMAAVVTSLPTSHVAMLSRPKEVADVILSAASATW